MSARSTTRRIRKTTRPRAGRGRAAAAHAASAMLSPTVVSISRRCGSRSCSRTEGSTITPSSARSPVAAAVAADKAPSTRSQSPVHAQESRPASQARTYSSALAGSNASGKWTSSGWRFWRRCAPGSSVSSTRSFDRLGGQEGQPSLHVLMAGDLHRLAHLVDHVVGQGGLVLGGEQNVDLPRRLEQPDGDALAGAVDPALLVGRTLGPPGAVTAG